MHSCRRTARSTAILLLLFISGHSAACAGVAPQEDGCSQGSLRNTSGICVDPGALTLPLYPASSVNSDQSSLPAAVQPAGPNRQKAGSGAPKAFAVYFFRGRGCPHCEKEKSFLRALQRELPAMTVKDYEVWYDKENAALLARLMKAHGLQVSGVPITFVDGHAFAGFSSQTRRAIEEAVRECGSRPCVDPMDAIGKGPAGTTASTAQESAAKDNGTFFNIPLIGTLNAQDASLPVMTLVIAGLDSFNPCAFFVLLSLLGLLVHARSRNRMLLIGLVFVFFSGFVYFLFMAAWLNLFLVMGQVAIITTVAGVVSVIIAAINIKDFFLFKQGVSLSIPDSAKPGLFDRMRRLMRATSMISILAGTTVLAIVANSYELLCTAGFPLVFTRILTLQNLPAATYYLYLMFYNIVYVVPLLIIVVVFTATLGSRKLSEWQGRVLKLVSGSMMLGLGIVLLADPSLLSSLLTSLGVLSAAIVLSLIVATVTRRLEI